MAALSTPCISVCVVEKTTGLCVGCGRTAAEIAQWSQLDEPQRRAIMATLEARFDALDTSFAPNRRGSRASAPPRRD